MKKAFKWLRAGGKSTTLTEETQDDKKNDCPAFCKKDKKIGKKSLLAAFFLGGTAVFAFPPYGIIPVLFLSFSGFVCLLNRAERKKSAFGLGFFFGFSLFAFSLSWITNALKLDAAFYPFIPLAFAGMGVLGGLFIGCGSVLSFFAPAGWRRVWMFAAWWGILEWVRSWIFTGFPWNLLSSVWVAFLPVLQVESLTGPYVLSFLSCFVFSSFFFLGQKGNWKQKFWSHKFVLLSAVSLSFFACVWGGWRLFDAENNHVWGVRLRLVQPNIPQQMKWTASQMEENFMKHVRLSAQEASKPVTHVIWPESALVFYEKNFLFQSLILSALKQGATLISGALRVADEKSGAVANSILIIDDLGEIKGVYDKSHLVPFGEYVPLKEYIPLDKVVPLPGEFRPGNGPATYYISKAPPVGLGICYEIIFPKHVTDGKRRPSWIVNVANDAWYGISAGPYQHLAAAQQRAVEEGLPVVRSTNNGISAVITPYGRLEAFLPLGEEGILDADLPRALPPTFYSVYGEIFNFILFAISILLGYIHKKQINL